MKRLPRSLIARRQLARLSGASLLALATLTISGAAAAEDFRVGIVSFLSGQAADSFGVPAINGAKVMIDAFNKGKAPA
ncbi:MAG: ABC transporter substrate-binding protein, partial [Burkholderiaceae bacterium]